MNFLKISNNITNIVSMTGQLYYMFPYFIESNKSSICRYIFNVHVYIKWLKHVISNVYEQINWVESQEIHYSMINY